ncbi:recombinase family protein [Metapseudomonas sp. CR1201]
MDLSTSKKRYAVPYIRFSSEGQRYGSSQERQETLVAEWLARNPEYKEYERKFKDLAVSGFDGVHAEEGELGKLLAAIKDGCIPPDSVVLVEAMDRFSRLEPMDTLTHLRSIVQTGIEVITLEDNQRYDATCLKDHRLLYLAMKAQAAHDFSQRLSGLVADSYTERAKEAKAGNPIKRRNPFWLTSEGKCNEKKAVIEQAFLMFIGGTPLKAIANQLSDHFANRQSLRHALKNPAAIGHWQRVKVVKENGKNRQIPGELIKNVFEPAVSDEVFYQAQKMLNDLSEQAPTVARKFPLAGLLVCGECGANMVLLRAGVNGKTDAVRCYKRMANSANCTNQKTVPVPVVGWFFNEVMRPHAFRAYQRTKLPETQRQRIKLEGQIDQLRQQKARQRKFVDLDPDDPDVLAEYASLVAEEKAKRQELASLPAIGHVEKVPIAELYRFAYGDRFKVANLLQLDGFRIICHRDGTIEENKSADDNPPQSVQYIGYSRKHKRWSIQYPDGDVISVDRHANQ